MIKDVMVSLEGTAADDLRLSAVETLAALFDSHITGLFLSTMPPLSATDATGLGSTVLERAREVAAETEKQLAKRLAQLNRPAEVRRIDVLAEDIAETALARRAQRTSLSLYVPMEGLRSRSGSSKLSSSAPVGISFSFPTARR
jgi:hypothetical protein